MHTCPDPCPQSTRAADVAVKRTFSILGVDVDNPKEVELFRMSLRFSGTLQQAAQKGVMAFAAAFGTVFAAVLIFKIFGWKL